MSSKSIIDQAKLANWASLFSDQKTSGLSVTEWCLQNSISKNKFFYCELCTKVTLKAYSHHSFPSSLAINDSI